MGRRLRDAEERRGGRLTPGRRCDREGGPTPGKRGGDGLMLGSAEGRRSAPECAGARRSARERLCVDCMADRRGVGVSACGLFLYWGGYRTNHPEKRSCAMKRRGFFKLAGLTAVSLAAGARLLRAGPARSRRIRWGRTLAKTARHRVLRAGPQWRSRRKWTCSWWAAASPDFPQPWLRPKRSARCWWWTSSTSWEARATRRTASCGWPAAPFSSGPD